MPLGVSASAGVISEGISKLMEGGTGSCPAAAGEGGAGIEVRLELKPATLGRGWRPIVGDAERRPPRGGDPP